MSNRMRLRTALAVVTLLGVAAPAAAVAAAKPKLPVILRFSPSSAAATAKIVVVGRNFSHVELVKVDGLRAKFKLDSATKLIVTVPKKAKSGKLAVMTSAGTARSAHVLRIKA
jgi:hypothetical protein